MKVHCSKVFFTFVALLWIVLVGVTEGNQKFCGKSLTDAMDLLCVNGYQGKLSAGWEKRSRVSGDDLLDYNDLLLLETPSSLLMYPAPNSDLNPLFGRLFANILVKTRRRREGGVYDECCRKACSYSELAAYCKPA